jgi:hypothetical protein
VVIERTDANPQGQHRTQVRSTASDEKLVSLNVACIVEPISVAVLFPLQVALKQTALWKRNTEELVKNDIERGNHYYTNSQRLQDVGSVESLAFGKVEIKGKVEQVTRRQKPQKWNQHQIYQEDNQASQNIVTLDNRFKKGDPLRFEYAFDKDHQAQKGNCTEDAIDKNRPVTGQISGDKKDYASQRCCKETDQQIGI